MGDSVSRVTDTPAVSSEVRTPPRVVLPHLSPAQRAALDALIPCVIDGAPPGTEARADLVQPVAALPRAKNGAPRHDILNLIAMNQVTALNALLGSDTALAATVEPILAGRLNFSDRRITRHEPQAAG